MTHPLPTRASRWFVALFFVMIAFPFLGVFPYIHVVMNPNENTRTYMTIAAVENGTFQLDAPVARFGWVNDMALVRHKKTGLNHYYSVKGPINSFMGIPVYWLQCKIARWRGTPPPDINAPLDKRAAWFEKTTWVLRFFTVQLPCWLFLIWLERYLRGFTKDTALRLIVVASVGLGTNYLGYAHMFASHSLFAVAAFIGFGMAERELREKADSRERSLSAAAWSGMGIAAATGLEYHGFFMSAVLTLFGLYVFWRPKQLVSYGLGALIPIALVAFYQWKAFGSPLTPGHKFVENAQWAQDHQRGLYGVIVPTWKIIGALSFDPGYGFFGMSPFMLFGVFGLLLFAFSPEGEGRARRTQRLSMIVALLAMLALWVAVCGAMGWRAGWTIGTRRAGAAPPFFGLAALMLFERISARWPSMRNAMRGVALGTTMVGIASLGLVGIVFNTLPEEITRPLTQFALPLVRVGELPHHNGELIGLKGTEFWYFVCVSMFLAPIVALFAGYERAPNASSITQEPKPKRVGWGMLLAIPVAIAAGYPAYHIPKTATPYVLDYWTSYWQPGRRDRIASLTPQAAKNPCVWHWIADMQEILNYPAAAAQTRINAGRPASQCQRWFFRKWFP